MRKMRICEIRFNQLLLSYLNSQELCEQDANFLQNKSESIISHAFRIMLANAKSLKSCYLNSHSRIRKIRTASLKIQVASG